MNINNLCRRSFVPMKFTLNLPCITYSKKETTGVSMVGGALKKKKMGKLGPMAEKKIMPVESDVNKLVNYVCGSNIYKTGEDIKIRPDSEYPGWLWNLHIGPALSLDELEPDSKEYLLKVRKMAMRRNNKLAQLKQF